MSQAQEMAEQLSDRQSLAMQQMAPVVHDIARFFDLDNKHLAEVLGVLLAPLIENPTERIYE